MLRTLMVILCQYGERKIGNCVPKYKKLTGELSLDSILGQAAQVIDALSAESIETGDRKGMRVATLLWLELAKNYIPEGVGSEGYVDLTGESEVYQDFTDQAHEPMGFRPNNNE